MTALSVSAAALTDFPLSSPCSRLLSLGGGSPVSTGAAHTGHTGDMRHVTITLLGHMDTSQEKLDDAGHTGGVQCRCSECEKLKDLEDKWICRLGSFHAPHGINTRDEIKARSRVNFTG